MGADQPRGRPAGSDLTQRTADVTLIDPSLSHLGRAFTYLVPDELTLARGSVVRVPFRGRSRRGVVTALDVPPVDGALPIKDTLGPGITEAIADLAAWTGERFLATEGEALAAATPKRVKGEEEQDHPAPARTRAPRPDLTWLDGYVRGDRLARALSWGEAQTVVLRPRIDRPRAPLIVSMVGAALARGRAALVLVPEVRATGAVVAALRDAFGDDVAWLGSDRATRARYAGWLAAREGHARVVVGGRAAVFTPVERLGLIVIDDEGQAAFKEGRAPRFHARTVAAERARRAGVPLVLVGVPPSVEARAACEGPGATLVAPRRAEERAARPPVTVVTREPGERLVPSASSLRIASKALAGGGRVALLIHRAGDPLARAAERAVRILKPSSHAIVTAETSAADLRRAARQAALLIATPVIAKDLPVRDVAVLVIAEADAALTRPSFRAPEEVFATWWRTASWVPDGHVVVETADPSQPAIAALTRWDPDLLFAAEAERRRELGYPPYASVARIDVPADRGDAVVDEVEAGAPSLEILGPVLDDAGKAAIVVRAGRRADLLAGLGPLTARWRAAGEPMRVDVDPWEVLVPKWRS